MIASYWIIATALAVLFYFSYFRKSRVSRFIDRFPHPLILPIIGNFWYFAKNEDKGCIHDGLEYQRKFGNRIIVAGGGKTVLFLLHPDDVKVALSTNECMAKSSLYTKVLKDWMGSTLFLTDSKKYFEMRKMVSPALEFKMLDKFLETFNEHSQDLISLLKANEAKGVSTEVHWLFTLTTLAIIFECLAGKNIQHHAKGSEYAVATHEQAKCVYERYMSPWLWPDALWRISSLGRREKANRTILHTFMDNILRERKAENLASKSGTGNGKLQLLDLLLQEQSQGKALTDKYIRDETNSIIFAGHDTVTSTLTWTIFLLASNPNEQEKLHLELDEVFGEDRCRKVESSDLTNLKYLEYCVKESLRLFPPAPLIGRRLEKDFKLDKDTVVPAGVELGFLCSVTHRLPEFFPEPDKFMPSRFLPENSAGRHPYCYFPFSTGSRSCMGQRFALAEAKTILAHIFRNFIVELESPEATVIPLQHLVTYPKDGVRIKLKLR